MNYLKLHKLFLTLITVASFVFAACTKEYNGPAFTIEGSIANAEGKSLRIFNVGIDSIAILDSVKLDSDGSFRFTYPRPECYDFYLLEIEGNTIVVAIDSTETVTINGNTEGFSETYKVEGNEASLKIKEMNELRTALEKQVSEMAKSSSPAIIRTRNEIYNVIGEFKENIIKQYIGAAPDKASAYYALTLTLNGEPLFNPIVNRTDSKCFAAVATQLQRYYPEAARTKSITEIAEYAIKSTRPARENKELEVSESEIKTTGLFDISLPTINGDSISLSSLAGKVVLLDFTMYEDTRMSSRNIKLREIYSKYNSRGFEIYQISYDTRKHFWQMSASNLPWTCVRDADGPASSRILLYNVQQLPTYYLINKENEVVLRDSQVTDLEKEIEKLLKQ